MDSALETMLNSAEICLERGQVNMAKRALLDIEERWPHQQEEDVEYRIVALQEALVDVELPAPTPSKPKAGKKLNPHGFPTCPKCQGSGRYGNLGDCFSCVGKGFQTPRDVVREKNYWARRERSSSATHTPLSTQLF